MCFIWPTTFSSSSSSSPSSLSLSFSQRFSDGPASTATRSSPKSDCPSMKCSSATRMLCACSFSLLAIFSSSLTLLSRFLHGKLGYEKIHRVQHKYTAPFRFAAPYAPGHMVTFWSWSRLRPLKTRSGDDFPWRC